MEDLKSLLKTTSPYLSKLADNHITTIEEFCYTFPRTYEDRSELLTFADIKNNIIQLQQQQTNPQIFESSIPLTQSKIITKVKIIKKTLTRTRTGKTLGEVLIEDSNGDTATINTLHSTFILSKLFPGKRYFLISKPVFEKQKLMFWHPEILPAEETPEENLHISGLYPIYPEMNGITPQRRAKKMQLVLRTFLQQHQDPLPEKHLKDYNLISTQAMLQQLHFPQNMQALEQAQRRLFFDRLLNIQLVSQLTRSHYIKQQQQKSSNRDMIK
jgi:ATP-dependent DNA helicase RecG